MVQDLVDHGVQVDLLGVLVGLFQVVVILVVLIRLIQPAQIRPLFHRIRRCVQLVQVALQILVQILVLFPVALFVSHVVSPHVRCYGENAA